MRAHGEHDEHGSTGLKLAFVSRRSTVHFARILGPLLEGGDLLILSGGLGAGKTFFTRALSRVLDVPSSVAVTSPTFGLVHLYEGRIPIAHADLYRLVQASELDELCLGELRAEGSLLLVEWGEPYEEALGGDALKLHLSPSASEHGRRAALSATGKRSQTLLHRLTRALADTPSSITFGP